MSNALSLKLIFSCALCVLAVFVPWWAVLVFLVGGFIFFETFYAGVAVGLFLDIFYGAPLSFPFPLPFLVFSLAAAILLPFLKRRLSVGTGNT